MWCCSHLSVSLSICLFAFPEGKAGQWAECFLEPAWEAKAKGRGEKKASIQSPIILYSWSPMCFYYLKHSPSTESSILSHCEAIIWGAISTDAKIVLFAKYWLSKMGPQGLNGREYWIPYPTSHWWIMVFLLALLSLICLISLHKLWIPTVRKCRL